ncbi:MAG: hypothetical protein WDW36_004773 [Sanguina aurantia]
MKHIQAPDYSFNRVFNKMYGVLIESDLRASYVAAKQRTKQRLRQRYNAVFSPSSSEAAALSAPPATPSPSAAASFSAAELAPLYGQYGLFRSAVFYVVGHASRALLFNLNTTTVEGAENLHDALRRPAGQALVTVSNHIAALDDPLVVSAILEPESLSQTETVRWTLCATDRCFKYGALSPFFRAAKVLPVARGAGMTQPGMAAAEERLQHGEWVHIFPEGTRSRDGALGPIRKGVGSLISSTATPPLVVPWVHRGMDRVLPRGKMLPAFGNEVQIIVGKPIPMEDLLAARRAGLCTDDQLNIAIAGRISTHMHRLTAQLDGHPAALTDHGSDGGGDSGGGSGPPASTDYSAPSPSVSGLDLFDPSDAVGGRRTWRQAWRVESQRMKARHRAWQERGVMRQQEVSLAVAGQYHAEQQQQQQQQQ